jgi:hypothetical protein
MNANIEDGTNLEFHVSLTENCEPVNIMLEHIGFNGDSMTVHFVHTENDMSGARA